ncbi:MAG: tRNA lysidine(34) synthetase TilS [Sandaracinus sp.]
MLLARVRRTIEAHGLLAEGDRVLLGLSGGADSVALLHALRALAGPLGLALEAATVDHGLRPGSAEEHLLVARRCSELGTACERVVLSLSPGPAIQERAREARYAALAELARSRGANAIAVAHTRDDQAETVLSRLLRGAGLRGLAGALPRRQDGVIRPLLDCDRADVLGYLASVGEAAWVEDPSNRDPRFLRTRIRTGLLPALATEEPAIGASLARLADEAREQRELVEALADAVAIEESPTIEELRALRAPVRREVLRRWVGGARPLGRAHLEALEGLCLTARGEARLPGAICVRIEGGRLTRAALPTEDGGAVEEA